MLVVKIELLVGKKASSSLRGGKRSGGGGGQATALVLFSLTYHNVHQDTVCTFTST